MSGLIENLLSFLGVETPAERARRQRIEDGIDAITAQKRLDEIAKGGKLYPLDEVNADLKKEEPMPAAKPAKLTPHMVVDAKLTIYGAAEMTPAGRKMIAEWLRRHANDLIKQGPQYEKRFTGRYNHRKAA